MLLGDTIAAVSTPYGKGGVALLRVSGDRALEICQRVFTPKNQKKLGECQPRMAIYGNIYAPDAKGAWNAIDDGIATYFPCPASFTGEDTVEICCHGGVLLTQKVLTALLAAGARPAAAGEFTRRAFLNGKMGLSSAEALGNILEARTEEQLTLAYSGMGGRVEGACAEIYQRLRDVLASVYAVIDYPDEDLADMSREEIFAALEQCEASILTLSESYHTGHAIAEGIATVICGRPNAGKSSLYNRILGREAAIVTDIEGTTRDVLTENASLGKVTLRLFDTAGLRDTENPVERIGIEKAERALEEAELILAVFDVSREVDEEDRALVSRLQKSDATVIAVLNKTDVAASIDEFYQNAFPHSVAISAKEGEGMEALCHMAETLFTKGEIDIRRDAVLTNARQHSAAMLALEAVRRALSSLKLGAPVDLCCTDAEAAMAALQEIDGRAVSEDIVTQIFSKFCVGK